MRYISIISGQTKLRVFNETVPHDSPTPNPDIIKDNGAATLFLNSDTIVSGIEAELVLPYLGRV